MFFKKTDKNLGLEEYKDDSYYDDSANKYTFEDDYQYENYYDDEPNNNSYQATKKNVNNNKDYFEELAKKEEVKYDEELITFDDLTDDEVASLNQNNIEENTEVVEEKQVTYEDTEEPERNNIVRFMNIFFIVVAVMLSMIAIDTVAVQRYNVGPFFAIKTKTYKDGGTKQYIGFGYKVIKYHQLQGRRDTKMGLWTMPYSIEPTTISDLDLAIEFRNDPDNTYKKYYKQFLRINGSIESIDSNKNEITLSYIDPDNEYTLKIVCSLAEQNKANTFKKNQPITVIGTLTDFNEKTNKRPNTIYMKNCFGK